MLPKVTEWIAVDSAFCHSTHILLPTSLSAKLSSSHCLFLPVKPVAQDSEPQHLIDEEMEADMGV